MSTNSDDAQCELGEADLPANADIQIHMVSMKYRWQDNIPLVCMHTHSIHTMNNNSNTITSIPSDMMHIC